MQVLELVDQLYDAFVSTLPSGLRPVARQAPCRLGLTKDPAARWRDVFKHEITLGAPALFSDGMPGLSEDKVRDAVLAHALAILDAFASDRIEDGQIPADSELAAVFDLARHARNAAVGRLMGDAPSGPFDPVTAEAVVAAAVVEERAMLSYGRSGTGATFTEYEANALRKQAVAFPATLALAHAAGWSPRLQLGAQRVLEGCALGLQLYDDVVDWEEDLQRNASWPHVLAVGLQTRAVLQGDWFGGVGARRLADHDADRPANGSGSLPPMRRDILASGVLAALLQRSRHHFRTAALRATALHLPRVASWARGRADKLALLALSEAKHAGFAARAHALGPWASEVLA